MSSKLSETYRPHKNEYSYENDTKTPITDYAKLYDKLVNDPDEMTNIDNVREQLNKVFSKSKIFDDSSDSFKTPSGSRTLIDYSKYLPIDVATRLTKELAEFNGDLFYYSIEAGSTWLPEKEFMVIPRDIAMRHTVDTVSNVGTGATLSSIEFLQIVALNYDKLAHLADKKNDRLYCSIIRALILSRKVLNSSGKAFSVRHDEIELVDHDASEDAFRAVSSFISDPNNKDTFDALATLSILAPVMATIQFVKTGHHYIDEVAYKNAYDRHFRSAVRSNIKDLVSYSTLFHTAIHWMGPNAMYHYSLTMKRYGASTDGLAIKLQVAPAGSAPITTSVAIFRAMRALPFWVDFYDVHGKYVDLITSASDKILSDPLSYHKRCDLFEKESLTNTEEYKLAMEAATILSPFTQGFVNILASESPLAGQKTLIKRAEENFGILKIFEAALRRFLTNARRTTDIRHALTLQAAPASLVNTNEAID